MIPKFRAWVKPEILSNHMDGVIAEAKPDFIERVCLVKRDDLIKNECFDEIFDFDDVILMQSTGLKDCNGVEIYEGDILKCASRIYTNLGATGTGEYEETIKQVIWKDDSWGTRVISSNLTSKGAEKSGLVISAKYAEVVGNIYEDPELLEGR